MTTKEYNEMMSKYRFDWFIQAEALKTAQRRRCLHWLEDIEMAGYEQLAVCLQRYDPSFQGNTEESNSFVAYVTTSIRLKMLDFIDIRSRLVRIPKSVTYEPNRDYDIGEKTEDINGYNYDQIDPVSIDDDEIEILDGDSRFIFYEAVRQILSEPNHNDTKWGKKVEAYKQYYQLFEHQGKEKQVKDIWDDLDIAQTTLHGMIKQTNKRIKERYDKLYNQHIRAKLRTIYNEGS